MLDNRNHSSNRPSHTHYSGGVKKRKHKGGDGNSRNAKGGNPGATPLQSYAFNGSDARQSALNNQAAMNGGQQELIDNHGGRKKRRTFKRKRFTRQKKKSIKRRRRQKKRTKRRVAKRKAKRKTHRRRLSKRRRYRGGDGNCGVPTKPVAVPSFGGSVAGPVGATSNSKGGNSTNMQAGADACNDHYATAGGRNKKSRKMKGGKSFQNWRDNFTGFGESMTGGLRKSRKKKAGTSKRGWESCMSGGKVRPFAKHGGRELNTTVSRGGNTDGTYEPYSLF